MHDFKRLGTVANHTGGAGDDTLTGGAGDDQFVYTAHTDIASSSGESGDDISDFDDAGDDLIQFDVFGGNTQASGFFSGFGGTSIQVLDTVNASGTVSAGGDLDTLSAATGTETLSALLGSASVFATAGNAYFSGSLENAIDSFEAFLTGLTVTADGEAFLAFGRLDDGTDEYLAVAFVDTASAAISAGDVDIRTINLGDDTLTTSDIEFLAAG